VATPYDASVIGVDGDRVDVTLAIDSTDEAGWQATVDPATAPAAGVWEPGDVTVELVADGRVAAARVEITGDGHVRLVGATPFSGGGG
jgi:hypothetical protein